MTGSQRTHISWHGPAGLFLGLTLLAACSRTASPTTAGPTKLGSESLAPTFCQDVQDMYVVAHQDDDLLFMNPDVNDSLKAGHCVLTVYLTTGDNPVGVANYNTLRGTSLTPSQYAQQREEGMLFSTGQLDVGSVLNSVFAV